MQENHYFCTVYIITFVRTLLELDVTVSILLFAVLISEASAAEDVAV